MINIDNEFYSSPYYFLLRDKGKYYSLYYSSESTLNEARKKDEMVKVPKEKIDDLKKYLEKLIKSKKKKTTKELGGEIDELVNLDGAFSNSKVPILDPRLHPKKTMDQTVSAARITNDPISRGYRTYYGESVESEVTETDMSSVFGYEETSGMTGPKAYKYFMKELGLEPSDAEERVRQQGKNPFKNKKKITISEIQKQKAIKMLEDILMNKKKNDRGEISDKVENKKELSKIIKKNINTLMRQAEKQGFTKEDILNALKGE